MTNTVFRELNDNDQNLLELCDYCQSKEDYNSLMSRFRTGELTNEDKELIYERWKTSYECGAYTHYLITKDEPSKDVQEKTYLVFTEEELEDILEPDDDPEFNHDLDRDNEGEIWKYGPYFIIVVYVSHG